jgi:hypothetical protein
MRGTLTHPAGTTETVTLLREGWSLLVNQLGVQKATEFVLLFERGKGDTVEEITRYWGDTSIDEMHAQIRSWKQQQSSSTLSHAS